MPFNISRKKMFSSFLAKMSIEHLHPLKCLRKCPNTQKCPKNAYQNSLKNTLKCPHKRQQKCSQKARTIPAEMASKIYARNTTLNNAKHLQRDSWKCTQKCLGKCPQNTHKMPTKMPAKMALKKLSKTAVICLGLVSLCWAFCWIDFICVTSTKEAKVSSVSGQGTLATVSVWCVLRQNFGSVNASLALPPLRYLWW